MIKRNKTRPVKVGNVTIGGNSSISVQSMCKTFTHDIQATVRQIHKLEDVGCEIVRVAVPDIRAVEALPKIKRQISIPLVADVHFNYNLALKSLGKGIDKLRINPGNIGDEKKIKLIGREANNRGIPIRVGVNSGSLEKDLLRKYGSVTPEAMVESVMRCIKTLEDVDFSDIVVSLKASDTSRTVKAYELIAKLTRYPLHLGITEAGSINSGMIKSAIGIGHLLAEGIGDTIRVSLTGDPREEVKVGFEILKSLNLRKHGANLISCPTCGRTEIDLIPISKEVERRLQKIKEPITVAVMGCVVNGPGEAKEADVGVAGGKKVGAIFRKGNVVKTVKENEIIDALFEEIDKILDEKYGKS